MRMPRVWRRAFPTLLLVTGFVLLYQATASDSRSVARRAAPLENASPFLPGTRLEFAATAYCKGTTTASGAPVRTGIAAAHPKLLPVGSVIQAEFDLPEYNGVYTVMDTGPAVRGRQIDVYMWSCYEALRFGRQGAHLVVLRLGWNPRDTLPLIETLFRGRPPASPPLPPPLVDPARPQGTDDPANDNGAIPAPALP